MTIMKTLILPLLSWYRTHLQWSSCVETCRSYNKIGGESKPPCLQLVCFEHKL